MRPEAQFIFRTEKAIRQPQGCRMAFLFGNQKPTTSFLGFSVGVMWLTYSTGPSPL